MHFVRIIIQLKHFVGQNKSALDDGHLLVQSNKKKRHQTGKNSFS